MKGNKVRTIRKSGVIGGVTAFFAALLLLLAVASVLTVRGIIGENQIEIVTCICAAIASVLSGIIALHGSGNRLLVSAETAGTELLLTILCGVIWKKESKFSVLLLYNLCCILLPALLVALLCGKKRRRGAKPLRRR